MEIIKNINTNINDGPLSGGVGFFDGLHLGHKAIIDKAEGVGKRAVISFENQPAAYISGEKSAHRLTTNAQRIEIFENMGIDYLLMFPFDEKMRNMTAEEFFEKAVLKNNIRKLVCGFNFRFGKQGKGSVQLLERLCAEEGIILEVVEPFTVDGEVVSSTLIKKYLYKGDAKKAAELLGRNFTIEGVVAQGKKLGRTLGFPTANIYVSDEIIVPKWGVYESYTTVRGRKYPSVTNIGTNPTVGDNLRLESHIIGFSGDIYGEVIKVEFADFLRGEMKFDSINELQLQVHKDIATVRDRQKK